MKNPFIPVLILALLTAGGVFAADSRVKVPEELEGSLFSDDSITPAVASLGVAASGAVYAGVDQIGSLGKGGGKGRIIRLVDTDHDGKADKHTVFAVIDNPRGIIPMGDKVYVLHSKWGEGNKYEGAFISILEDKDGDGVADGPPKIIVSEISSRKYNEKRGVDSYNQRHPHGNRRVDLYRGRRLRLRPGGGL